MTVDHSSIEMVISARDRDLGGFSVRRILPYASHRMVGPFVFFDHMGPADFAPGQGIDVRPHPHIGLATVTYLFEGTILHRDSLGSRQLIEPGAINWMTAGRGIVHSERTPEPLRSTESRMNGIQCWVALPEEYEEVAPSFAHHPKTDLPEFEIGSAKLKLLLGRAFDRVSPVLVHSDLLYLDAILPAGCTLPLIQDGRELAFYVVSGSVTAEGKTIGSCQMAICRNDRDIEIHATEDAQLMILGGSPVGKRHIYWNLVSSSKERIEEAKIEWRSGPRAESARFQPIPDDHEEFIPLPNEPDSNPKGTMM